MQVLLGGANVGALLDKLRWHAEGKVARQPERGQREFLRRLLARQTTRQRRNQMALLRKLPLQRRQRLFDLRQRSFLGQNVRLCNLAGVELGAQQLEHVIGDLDELVGGVDLATQRRLLNGGESNVRRERQVSCFKLEALVVRLGLE